MDTGDEPVDIINEMREFQFSCPKREAHARGLLHPTILAEVIDSEGNWTLVKQAHDRQDAGRYVSPVGGHIRSGESDAASLKREAYEEMGLKKFKYQHIGSAVYYREIIGRKENHLFVLFEIYTDQEPALNHESVSLRVFPQAVLKQQMKEHPELFGDAWHFVANTFYRQLFYD
ncbi:hypothetical protein A2Z33_06800 [Candidatus Gottesmanbacteria bacterium RBG_16_52_11]|uniref:Nudix hydrolase domain-containing protein n=1 Tax=Candidatus Gottesmanbacteria bacterium RBG_16_52_11 TaxID=1798374 RepID=A0A1F5YXR3_9BACT|nr:MAG: hypothetical protein A2Z33_06800 [Candidatus Gottesmanbacteria bacterium RBG_16_52_11]